MTRICSVTGRGPMSGHTVSHANNKRKRRFLVNLHTKRIWLEEENRYITLRVSARGLRTIEKVLASKGAAGLHALLAKRQQEISGG